MDENGSARLENTLDVASALFEVEAELAFRVVSNFHNLVLEFLPRTYAWELRREAVADGENMRDSKRLKHSIVVGSSNRPEVEPVNNLQ